MNPPGKAPDRNKKSSLSGTLAGDCLRLFLADQIHDLRQVFQAGDEPFGIVVLEAWSAGLPVISSNAGGLKDFVVHKRNGLLFSPDDMTALVENYKQLMDSSELRASLVAAALEDVKQYSWTALSQRLIGFYRELLSSR